MMTRREELIENKISTADFSSEAIDSIFAHKIAAALLLNTSVQKISFKNSNLSDSEFKILADALIKRNLKLSEMNIDNTNITTDSIPILNKLIENKIVINLLMYSIENIDEESDAGVSLAESAEKKGTYISFEHPRKRLAIGFFEKSVDEIKEFSSVQTLTNEQEMKAKHDTIQVNPFKKY